MKPGTHYFFIFFVSLALLTSSSGAKPAKELVNPVLVRNFCEKHPAWFADRQASAAILEHLVHALDSAAYFGLDGNKYHYNELKQLSRADSSLIFADALISFCKDLYTGADLTRWIINDEISPDYNAADGDIIIEKLMTINRGDDLHAVASTLEPVSPEYMVLKNELKGKLDSGNLNAASKLTACLNIYRWVHHFHFPRFILVNIPNATLRYFELDSEVLNMKVVVGKPATRTPRFSSFCKEVILYPYWNVPRSIAVKELLPKFKRSPAAIDAMNIQVITRGGKVVDHHALNWSQYNGANFPYIFRQSTGCDNSLGVIKFNLTDPFDVYLHDTNFKKAFSQKSRFLSHGCIRLEKPIELGNYLLDDKLDTGFVKACIEGEKPVIKKLDQPVPVFVVYLPVTADTESKAVYHKDIYRLFK